VAFLLGFGPAERPSAPFYHLTAEMNSASAKVLPAAKRL